MAYADNAERARAIYRAFVDKDRDAIEGLIGEPFSFTSPYDDHIDRETYFERCWANAGQIRGMRIRHLQADGDEVFVLYEVESKDGPVFRNTEFLRFQNGKLAEVEVFFGEINGVEQKP
jgi:ketosteroid isomerase-like protein